MYKLTLAGLVAALVVAGCGVNPDRMATMREKSADVADTTAAEELVTVEYSDSDPKGIRDAVMAYQDMKTNLESGDAAAYQARRNDLVTILQLQASPEVQEHSKFVPLFNGMRAMDARFAAPGGEKATTMVGSDRVTSASMDALYAVQDGLDACERSLSAGDATTANDLWRKYEASMERAVSIDSNSTKYVGKRPAGSGVMDVPFEAAFCEVRMAQQRIEAEDEPAAPQDMGKTYMGCGYYELDIEAEQVGANRFGEYAITTFSATNADPGAATKYNCERIPPMTDSPSPVQRVVRNTVSWMAESDINSMAGPFEYEQRTADKLYKKGKVRIYRRNATLKSNRCGSEDPNVTCEAEGSDVARAYNHARHYLKRADFHRQGGRAARCKEMAGRAYKALNSSTGSADKDKTLLSAEGETMTSQEANARIEAMKSEANDMMASDWCNTK